MRMLQNLESLVARAIPRAAWLSAALFAGASFTSAATLPEGPGKAETTRICGKCHSLDQAISLRQGRAGWQETISKMVNLGAEGSQSEVSAILNYLVKNYGSANANPATDGTAGAP